MPPAATTAALQSHCIRARYGLMYLGILAIVGALLAGIIGGVLLTENMTPAGVALLVLGAVLLLPVVPLMRRGQLPLDVALTEDGLQLTPVGRSVQAGMPAERLPLASISGYSSTEQNNALLLKLYLADNRTLTLADKPRSFLKELEPGFVPLTELSAALAARKEATGDPVQQRPNFFQGFWGHALAVVCGLCFAAGVVLLFLPDVEWTQGLRLLTFSSIYLGAYLRNRRKSNG